jgi:hypothetical protein
MKRIFAFEADGCEKRLAQQNPARSEHILRMTRETQAFLAGNPKPLRSSCRNKPGWFAPAGARAIHERWL